MKKIYKVGNSANSMKDAGWFMSTGYDANCGYYTEQAEKFGEIPIACNTWIPFPDEIVNRLRREMELQRLEESFWKRLKFLFIN
jgi:hypothetical protein